MTVAQARANIALVKYWGKQGTKEQNLPATPSLSITLDSLSTRTFVENAGADRLELNGVEVQDAKVAGFLGLLRGEFDIPTLHIRTQNNFPTGAGLASSASGFAALIVALNAHCELGLNAAECSVWARKGSASAARSLFGGFVSLTPPEWAAQQLHDAAHWPLQVVVAVTEVGTKPISSSKGMEISRKTSEYFDAWTTSTAVDFEAARSAIAARDFDALAQVAEHSSMKMHALMLSSQPPLLYWNSGTIACLHTVRSLQERGLSVFATIDAGPQVEAGCLPGHAEGVQHALSATPGVVNVLHSTLGAGANVID